MINERIIEIEVTEKDLEQMRAEGAAEQDLPQTGVKRYRPARHIVRDKVVVLLDADIVEHFKIRDEKSYQTQINQQLRELIKRENIDKLSK